MTEIIIPAITGLISGAIGSLIAPWVSHAVEKRRNRNNYRRDLIRDWRNQIERFVGEKGDLGGLGESGFYASLRPHLNPDIRKELESNSISIMTNSRGNSYGKQVLQDEISRIESEWNLV